MHEVHAAAPRVCLEALPVVHMYSYQSWDAWVFCLSSLLSFYEQRPLLYLLNTLGAPICSLISNFSLLDHFQGSNRSSHWRAQCRQECLKYC